MDSAARCDCDHLQDGSAGGHAFLARVMILAAPPCAICSLVVCCAFPQPGWPRVRSSGEERGNVALSGMHEEGGGEWMFNGSPG